MSDSSDQTQTTNQDTNQQPSVSSSDQPSVETSLAPEPQPTTEQPASFVPSEPTTTPNTQISRNPEPRVPSMPETQPPEQRPVETSQPAKSETPSQTEQIPVTPPAETQPPVINIPALHYPFSGNIPVTFAFGAQSDNEDIKKKFTEWGIVGHNGLDFGLTTGTEVFACDSGKVIQSGDNGDFGISITVQHSWGQSLYAHLSESKVKVDDEIQVNEVIGLSGKTGAAFGEHLHFAIKPTNPDNNNGYLGFIDPSPYLSLPSQKEEIKQEPQTPPVEEQKPLEQPQETNLPETPQQPPVEEMPSLIKPEPEKPVEQPKFPQVSDEEIQKKVDEKLKAELELRRQKANEARIKKKTDKLNRILELVGEKKIVTNDEIRDYLHVSQSTATNYLSELVSRGMLRKEGKRGGAKYSV